MRVLFIGGTGNISSACTNEALRKGFEVFHLNRGNRPEKERPEAKVLRADIREPEAVRKAIGSLRFDSVVQFLAFEPKHIEVSISKQILSFLGISPTNIYSSVAVRRTKSPPSPRLSPKKRLSKTHFGNIRA